MDAALLGFWGSIGGGLIGGVMTLAGGRLAYRAGRIQAKATSEAARIQVEAIKLSSSDQIKALENQLKHVQWEQEERDRRIRRALLNALAMEAARVKMLAEERAKTPYMISISDPINRMAIAKAYLVESTIEVRHNADLDALTSRSTALAARLLISRLDQLNTQIMMKSTAAALQGGEIYEPLLRVIEAANQLQASVGLELDMDGDDEL